MKTTKLKSSTVGTDAFKKVYSKPIVKVKSSVLRKYKKFINKKGLTKKATIKKLK